VLFRSPNLYGEDPSVQISPLRGAVINNSVLADVKKELQTADISTLKDELVKDQILLRFSNTEDPLKASDIIKTSLGNYYIVALNLAPATPKWLRDLNASPMYLGLDLRGGVHFLLEVDMQAAEKQAVDRTATEIRQLLRENKLRYLSVVTDKSDICIKFRTEAIYDKAEETLSDEFKTWDIDPEAGGSSTLTLIAKMSTSELTDIRQYALQQNIITLKNRVNELGLAEPIIQRQGDKRIVVELPGVQDTARAKEILGATATLEYRMVDTKHSVSSALAGRVPLGSKLYKNREGGHVLLKKQIIVTGSEIVDASSGIENETGSAMVSVSLDGPGGKKMSKTDRKSVV